MNEHGQHGDTVNTDTTANTGIRLQTFLAHAGAASRRASERLILEGRVSVNGEVITAMGVKVSASDCIAVDGIAVSAEKKRHYLALHKPPGYICSSSDPEGRPLALDLLPLSIGERLYNIGRLDLETSGLLLFTNDGAFAAKIGHPHSGIEKEYEVSTTRPFPDEAAAAFVNGIEIDGVVFRAKTVTRLSHHSVSVVLIEGNNREIRRVCSYFHLHITRLKRVRIGNILLGTLAEGASRPLTAVEIEGLTHISFS
jgi:23S rRNA pseudouridine2605 synthase